MIPIVREIGGFLRGNATPFQLFTASFLGGMISFMPGFQQAPGLVVTLTLLMLVLNTNLMFAGLVMGVGRLLALAVQPVTFNVGEFFIDGPTTDFLTQLINGPITAWFGFENYIATGGLAVGAGFGAVIGIVTNLVLGTFRSRMAKLETASQAYKLAMDNKFIQAIGWLFFGGHKGDEDWAAMSKRKVGKPVRYVGIAAVVAVVGLIVASPHLINDSWLAKIVSGQLSRANGATVDIETIETDLAGGQLAVNTLALTDPNNLDQNLFQSIRLEAKLSNQDLYARKYALDRLEVSGAKVGEERDKPGRKIGPDTKPSDDPAVDTDGDGKIDSGKGDTGAGPAQGEGKGSSSGSGDGEDRSFSIESAMEKADEWKANLAEIKKWLGKITGNPEPGSSGTEEIPGETLEERLRRLAAELGYANVFASHRITDKPRFTIHELVVNDVTVSQLKGEVLNVLGTDLSTEPYLIDGASTINVSSESGKLGLELTIDRDSGPVSFHYKDLPVDEVKGWLKDSSKFPFQGGSFNIQGTGTLSGGEIYIPVQVTPINSQINLPGIGLQKLPETPFTVVFSGELDNPKIRPDLSSMTGGLKQGLIDAGKNKAKEKIGDKLNSILGGDKEGENGEGSSIDAKGMLDGFLNRKKDK